MSTHAQPITAYFEADHDRLDLLFRNFQAYKNSDYPKAKTYFKNFLQGLKRHIVWEEDILFPFFESHSSLPKNAGPTEVMRQEHRQIGAALEELHNKVREQNPDSGAEENAILSFLKPHNDKEENILYPMLDDLAKADDAAEIFLAMEQIPTERFKTCCGTH